MTLERVFVLRLRPGRGARIIVHHGRGEIVPAGVHDHFPDRSVRIPAGACDLPLAVAHRLETSFPLVKSVGIDRGGTVPVGVAAASGLEIGHPGMAIAPAVAADLALATAAFTATGPVEGTGVTGIAEITSVTTSTSITITTPSSIGLEAIGAGVGVVGIGAEVTGEAEIGVVETGMAVIGAAVAAGVVAGAAVRGMGVAGTSLTTTTMDPAGAARTMETGTTGVETSGVALAPDW